MHKFSLKNRIQAAVEVKNDGETLGNLYVMLKGLLRIYKDYQFEP